MEHKKKTDLYQMADRYKQNGWKRVDAEGDFGLEKAEPKIEAGANVEMQIPQRMEMEIEIPQLDIMMAMPAPPEEENACGYCITLAMSYTPMQKWNTTYEAEVGFNRGTIFPELDLPFLGEEVCNDDR